MDSLIIEIFQYLSVIGCVVWLFSILLFTRTTMKTIERKLLAEGIDIPWWDKKGWGFRISIFTSILARGKHSKYPVLADEAILRHSRTYDRVLAIIVEISFVFCMLLGGIIYFFFEN